MLRSYNEEAEAHEARSGGEVGCLVKKDILQKPHKKLTATGGGQ